MKTSLRIVIADDEPSMREYLRETLQLSGHQVVAVAETGRELLDVCRTERPDLVISDVKMPDVDGLDAAAAIYVTESIPVIIISAFHDPKLMERAQRNHISAYLVKPIKQADLEATIAITMGRFDELQALRNEAENLRQAMEDQSVIERAKAILMKLSDMSGPEAFVDLRRRASENRRRLVEIAQMIVLEEQEWNNEATP